MLGVSTKGDSVGGENTGNPPVTNGTLRPFFTRPSAERARGWFADLTAHNFAENLRTQRAVDRRAHGLDMNDYPYPGAQNASGNTTNNTQSALGWALGPLLGVGLAAAGAAGVMALLPKAAPSIPTAPAIVTASPQEFDFIDQLQQADGTWKPTGKVERKRINPDGTTQTKQPDGSWK